MNRAFQSFTDAVMRHRWATSAEPLSGTRKLSAPRKRLDAKTLFAILLIGFSTSPVRADGPARGTGTYSRGNYARAVRELTPAAMRGNARAQGQLGFMYENGFGVPQNYAAAADLYQNAAAQGDAFAQSRLGLSYDKGHGVPKSVILSYTWLNLAAARASGRERDFYRRLRDAVASKMTYDQIVEGQRLALIWAPIRW